jgi:hypothetical protein
MYNGIFIIPSALIAKPSVSPHVTNEERFEQTIETLESIDKYCPNSLKLIIDVSYSPPEQFKIDELVKLGAVYINGSENETVRQYSEYGHKSLGETCAILIALNYIQQNSITAKRIYKMCARYCLTEDFKYDVEDQKNSYVFLPSRFEPGLGNILETRLWHLDFSLFENFSIKIGKILNDLLNGCNCIELSFYNNLHTEKMTYVSPIGSIGKLGFFGNCVRE